MTIPQYITDFRERAAAAGKCNICGQHPHAPSRKRCQPCLDACKVRYAARKQQGCCTWCKTELRKDEHNPCDACHLKRETARNRRRAEAILYGKCSRCFKEDAMLGRRRCLTCTEKTRARLAK